MKILEPNIDSIFNITNESQFNELALQVFNFQYHKNIVYKEFVDLLNIKLKEVTHVSKIPFLPISFFKTHDVLSAENYKISFMSSGTTSQNRSKHLVTKPELYNYSFAKAFKGFYGDVSEYCFLGLLPSYLEQGDSSLVYMVNNFIERTKENGSGFYLTNFDELNSKINQLESENKKYILIGVSYALLDFSEKFPQRINSGIVMETGGMKGRRKELTKVELHQELSKGFGVKKIHSEYGMTELLSQAYSKGEGVYDCPPWMKIVSRSVSDPFKLIKNKRGLLNVIDLANLYSCSFISTDDLGIVNSNGSFRVIGRFDTSEVRGCNLMVN